MAYIFDDEFQVYKHEAELRVYRNSAKDTTRIVINDKSWLEFSFVLEPSREIRGYTLKVEDVNETRELGKKGWELVTGG